MLDATVRQNEEILAARLENTTNHENTISSNGVRQSHKINQKIPIKIDQYILIQNANILMKHSEYKLALQLLRQALDYDTKNPAILKPFISSLEKLGFDQEAERAHKALTDIETSFENLSMRGHNFYRQGKDQEAMQSYFESLAHLIDEHKDLYAVHKNLGNIFCRQGDFESAEENYNKAYTRNPHSDTLLVNYGALEVQKGDLDKALFCFRKAVEINPQNDKAWVGLGLVHSQFGDFELAWANIIKGADINPLNRTALILLAQWSHQISATDTIIEKFLNYFDFVSEDTEISILLIKLWIEKKDAARAQIEFTRAYAFDPKNEELNKLKSVLF